MFLLYYAWGFLFYLVYLFFPYFENLFLKQNNPYLIKKRTFKFISIFEKFFLVLFYKNGWFEDSIANLYRKNDILDYRTNKFPLIKLFHLYYEKKNYTYTSLKLIVKDFDYYRNLYFYKKFSHIFDYFFKSSENIFLNYLTINNLLIINYFNAHSTRFFKTTNSLNLIKLNRVFNIFIVSSNYKFILFDLDKWVDWYKYNFNTNIIVFFKLFEKPLRINEKKFKFFKDLKIKKWIKIVFKYKKRYNFFYIILKKKISNIIFFKLNISNFFKIRINKDFKKLVNNYFSVKFSESSISKYINTVNLKNYNISYLRKNRIFNKGRYSRNRQLYRTGVYWCLWLNIIMVYGLYFIFYRFSFNFGYIWWGLLILAYSTIFSRIVKYNYYNIYYVYIEFYSLLKWYGSLFLNIRNFLEFFFSKYANNVNIYNYVIVYKNNNFSYFYKNYYIFLINFFNTYIKQKQRIKMKFIWMGMKEKDTSLFRYKTIFHFFKETYRLFTTW